MFVALVLFLAVLFAVDADNIDEEEEKLPTKCHGKYSVVLSITRNMTIF